MTLDTFGEVYAALVRLLGTPAEVSPGCVSWLASGRTGAGLTLQRTGPSLILSVVAPTTARSHAHWTLAGPPSSAAPFRDADEAIPASVQWLVERGVVLPGLRTARACPGCSRHDGEHTFGVFCTLTGDELMDRD